MLNLMEQFLAIEVLIKRELLLGGRISFIHDLLRLSAGAGLVKSRELLRRGRVCRRFLWELRGPNSLSSSWCRLLSRKIRGISGCLFLLILVSVYERAVF